MPRPKKVSLFLKGKTWYIRFQKNGQRIKKSCKTHNESKANFIAEEIEKLLIDSRFHCSSEAFEIFFDELPEVKGSHLADILDRFDDNETPEYMISFLAQELYEMTNKYNNLKKKIEEDDTYKSKYLNLLKIKQFRDIEMSKNCPSPTECLKQFQKFYEEDEVKNGNIKRGTATTAVTKVKRFFDFCDVKEMYLIDTSAVQSFIDYDFSMFPSRSRRTKTREHLSRFYSWAALKPWGIVNPVATLGKQKKARKRIKYFPSTVFIEILDNLDDYWKAIFSLLAFMGFNPNELAGIRTEDIYKTKKGYEIFVLEWQIEEYMKGVKTNNRAGGLKVFDIVKPYLDTFKAKGYTGKKIFFKALESKSAPRPKTKMPLEMWRPQQLSKELNQIIKEVQTNLKAKKLKAEAKEKGLKPPTPKELKLTDKERIKVQDLRRCAANYMLKELEMPIEKVAGILRNTPQTIWDNYAKYLPEDI